MLVSKSISTWVSLSCCCWRVDWNCSNAYRSCTDTIQNTLNNIWNQLKVISTQKNIINRAGNSDEWCTQNCPPQNCPPKGISRAGNSDIHLTIIHACILFLILVFYVLAQYEMLVFCNPLSKCPSATPFLFLLARTQYYFFLDKTKQFLYVFVDIVNTSCSMETTIVIWFLDMVTVTVYGKTTKWMVDLL